MTFKKTQLQQCTVQCQCDYNVSILVLQQYEKTKHPGNFTTSDLYYNRFSQLGKPSMYHTPRRPKLQFYDVIFSLVIIRFFGHCANPNTMRHCRRGSGCSQYHLRRPGEPVCRALRCRWLAANAGLDFRFFFHILGRYFHETWGSLNFITVANTLRYSTSKNVVTLKWGQRSLIESGIIR